VETNRSGGERRALRSVAGGAGGAGPPQSTFVAGARTAPSSPAGVGGSTPGPRVADGRQDVPRWRPFGIASSSARTFATASFNGTSSVVPLRRTVTSTLPSATCLPIVTRTG